MSISRLVVFVRSRVSSESVPGPEGPILYAEEPVKTQISEWNGTEEIGDLNFETQPPSLGILVWEGWITWSGVSGEDGDGEPTLEGSWRKLDHWEMCKVREGLPPWHVSATGVAADIRARKHWER